MWNFIKVYYYHFVDFQLKGIKPTRYRENFEKNNGYSIDITSGGKSNEGFIRVSKGLKTWYYPNYYRRNGIRINDYSLDLYNNKI